MSTGEGRSGLPARRLSSSEMEAVIRRSVELQAVEPGGSEGISEAEVIRIGGELGLDPATVRRAIADVRARPPEDDGMLAGLMGPGKAFAARSINRPPAEVMAELEEYLTRCEYMVPQRRFQDRTLWTRRSGISASVGRATRGLRSKHPSLDVGELQTAVAPLDEDACLIQLAVELRGTRAGMAAAGVLGGGGAGSGIAIATWATIGLFPVGLVGIPVAAAMILGMRGIYGSTLRSTTNKLESFLDRLEHRELDLPSKRGGLKQLGF